MTLSKIHLISLFYALRVYVLSAQTIKTATGYIDIGGFGIPLSICYNGNQAGTAFSEKYSCTSDTFGESITMSHWTAHGCSGAPAQTSTITTAFSQTNIFNCTASVSYWTGRKWGNETGYCAQDTKYWADAPMVIDMCLPAMYIPGQGPAGWGMKVHTCTECGCHLQMSSSLTGIGDGSCTQKGLNSNDAFGSALCGEQGHCWTSDPTVCTETQTCLSTPTTTTTTKSPTSTTTTTTKSPTTSTTKSPTESGATPSPTTSTTTTSTTTTTTMAPTSKMSTATGYIDIAGLGIPLSICYNANEAGKPKSGKYTCNSAGDTITLSSWSVHDCQGTADSTITITGTGLSQTHWFNCTASVSYWNGRKWGNETGYCVQDDDYWQDSPVVIDMCLPAMYLAPPLGNGPAGWGMKVHSCTDCGCYLKLSQSTSGIGDGTCTQMGLNTDDKFGSALCSDVGHCWTADPTVCTEKQQCLSSGTPSPTSSGGVVTLAPTMKPTVNEECMKDISKCGYFVFGALALPLNVCMGKMEDGKASSIMYQCSSDKQSVVIKGWDKLRCPGDPTETLSFNFPLFDINCADGIPNYWMTRVYGNQSGACVTDPNWWYEQPYVTDQCFVLTPSVAGFGGTSLEFTDCEGCKCTTKIYMNDAECKTATITYGGTAPYCDNTGHCQIATVDCDDQTCPIPPTPAPVKTPQTSAPTAADGKADCPYVNIAGVGFPLDVCIGGNNKTLGAKESYKYSCNDAKDKIMWYHYTGNTDCNKETATATAAIALPTQTGFNCYGDPCEYYKEKVYGNETGSCAKNDDSWWESYILINKCLPQAPPDSVSTAMNFFHKWTYSCSSNTGSYSFYIGKECTGTPEVSYTVKLSQCYQGLYHTVEGCGGGASGSNISGGDGSSSSSTGAIVGGVIGAVVVIAIAAGLIWFFCIKQKQSKANYMELQENLTQQ